MSTKPDPKDCKHPIKFQVKANDDGTRLMKCHVCGHELTVRYVPDTEE